MPKRKRKRSRYPRVIKPVRYQRGTSIMLLDKQLKALAPGKRRSRTGRIYWETRKNRSDKKGKRV